MSEMIIDESSLAHIERKSLTVLKRKQDEIFVGDSEYADLEDLVNDSGMLNDTHDISAKVSLGRNIFNLRKNYLKIRLRSTNSDNPESVICRSIFGGPNTKSERVSVSSGLLINVGRAMRRVGSIKLKNKSIN